MRIMTVAALAIAVLPAALPAQDARDLTAREAAGMISATISRSGGSRSGGKSDNVAVLRPPTVDLRGDDWTYVLDIMQSQVDTLSMLYPDGARPIYDVVVRVCDEFEDVFCAIGLMQQAIAFKVGP